jgi:hypothetical protein
MASGTFRMQARREGVRFWPVVTVLGRQIAAAPGCPVDQLMVVALDSGRELFRLARATGSPAREPASPA